MYLLQGETSSSKDMRNARAIEKRTDGWCCNI